MFEVIGIDENDGTATTLQTFNNSGEARAWMNRYVSSEDVGGWNFIEVIDTRSECAETVWKWSREDQDELEREVARIF